MIVSGMSLTYIKRENRLLITFKGEEGEVVLKFNKGKARQLMRAIWLQIGIDPRIGEKAIVIPGGEV